MSMRLFDMPAGPLPVRSSDPATSRRAARDLKLRQRQLECLTALRVLIVSSTADDIAAVLATANSETAQTRSEVASRLPELERAGMVRRIGVKQGRRGRAVQTWVLTADGRKAAVA